MDDGFDRLVAVKAVALSLHAHRQAPAGSQPDQQNCRAELAEAACVSCLAALACMRLRVLLPVSLTRAPTRRPPTHARTPLSGRLALSCLPCIQFPLSNCRGGSRSRTLAFYYQVLQFARSELMILLEAASRLVRSWKCWNLKNCVKFGSIQGCRTGLKERQERF